MTNLSHLPGVQKALVQPEKAKFLSVVYSLSPLRVCVDRARRAGLDKENEY